MEPTKMTDRNRTRHSLKPLARFAAAALLSGSVLAADPAAVRFYEDAVSRFNAGDAQGALIQLKNSLQRDPGQLPAKILLGRAQLALGQAALAEEELLQAQQLGADPVLVALPLAQARNALGRYQDNIRDLVPTRAPRSQQPDLWVELGLARLYSDDPGGAGIAFEEALKIDPLHAGARVGLARIPLESRRFAEAGELAAQVLADHPRNADAWFVKGVAAHAEGRFAAAAEAYGKAYQLDAKMLQAGLGEAAAHMDGGNPARAAALLGSMRRTDPGSPTIIYLQSQALGRAGQSEAARQALDEAAALVGALTPNDVRGSLSDLLLFGSIAFESGQNELAFQFLNAYVDGGGPEPRGRKLLARTLIAMGRPGDAIRALVRITAAGRADAETLSLVGDANVQLGDLDAAQRAYRDALLNHAGGPALVRRLAMAQYAAGQRDQGVAAMEELVGSLPGEGDLSTSLLLGFLYLAERQLVEAENLARNILAKAPADLTARNFLATVLVNQGRVDEGRALYQALVEQAPDFRPARYNLIQLDIAQGRLAEASRALARILAVEPEETQALYESARIARIQGDMRATVQLLEKTASLRPTWQKGIDALVSAYLAEGRQADALKAANALLAREPNSVPALLLLATAQAVIEPKDAAVTLKKASLQAGNDTRQLFTVGRRQAGIEAFEDAAWTFTKIAALDPEDSQARYELAVSLYRAGKRAEAETELAALIEQNPEEIRFKVLLADLHRAQGRVAEAIDIYREALQAAPLPPVAASLYQAQIGAGQPTEALATLEDSLQRAPDSLQLLNLLAEHHLTRGDMALARQHYSRLAELQPGNPQVLNNLAITLTDVDAERAMKAALAAYELAPQNPFVLDTLGWSLVQLGELERGLGYLREARARNATSPTVRYHIGVALQESGRTREALEEFRAALRLAEEFPNRAQTIQRITLLEQLP
jgi:cellulose synthase operon protein C